MGSAAQGGVDMLQLGDVTHINGAEIEPVDVITFGSPCQDLSIAGGRSGLDGERSSLFFEATRIIREMREATDGEYPTFIVWENVPGALSSAKGEDFLAVLQELATVAGETVPIPRPAGKWTTAGEIMGNDYSIAWRILDAQYWGVPQRRRRIYLVADFGGQRASEILFERDRLPRHFGAGRAEGKTGAAPAGGGAALAGGALRPVDGVAFTIRERGGCPGGGKGPLVQEEQTGTLSCRNDQYLVTGGFARRLTPLECERLQGYPDRWTDIPDYIDSKGRTRHAVDTARYKALGNSIALPCAEYVLQGILDQLGRGATLGSLFDGIGGFPLIWETISGPRTARWASEIEDFPLAVTAHHFEEKPNE